MEEAVPDGDVPEGFVPEASAGGSASEDARGPAVEPGAVAEPGPADPAPLGVVRTPTGVAEIDARLDRLGDADHLAVSGHLEVYEDVHRGLRDTLTALDRRPGPATRPGPRLRPRPAPAPARAGPVPEQELSHPWQ
ncbi:hypothetical protein NKH77_12655 [Streptomyces sp. M19]